MALIPYPSIVVVNSSSGSSSNIRRENIAPPFFLRIERYALTSPVSLRQTRRATPISRPTIGQWGYTNSRGGKHASWKKNDRDKDGIYSKFGWLRSGLFSFDEFSVEGEIRSKWENVIFSRSIFKRDYCYYDWAPASIPLGLKERRGEKMCGNSSLDRSAASSQHDSLDNVCIYSTDRHERTASTRKWKLAAKSYGFWRLSGFLTTPSANCLILKKKKKIRNVSREATSATRCIYKFFSVPIPIIPSLSSPSKRCIFFPNRKEGKVVLKDSRRRRFISLWRKKKKKRLKGYQLFREVELIGQLVVLASYLLPVTFSGRGLTVTCVVT